MYTYEYERVRCETGLFRSETMGYKEKIEERAKSGWRYVGYIPVFQFGQGYISEMDLIFEKEVP